MTKLYTKSGVNIEKADDLISAIKTDSANIGRFGAITEHPLLKDHYLVTTTDGIGSKITPLMRRKLYSVIAADLIAMNLNDLACSGAVPLCFTDYISVNKLESEPLSNIILELKKQLKNYGCELSGGETSELRTIIREEKIDIAGFTLGIVKKENLLCPQKVSHGDVIIGLASSGIHSNGFSLINYLYEEGKLSEEEFEKCLAPTIIYINEITKLSEKKLIHSAANITGGGILSNLKRALPKNLKADLNFSAIPSQPLFEKLYKLCADEAYEVFNMGAGFCVITNQENTQEVFNTLQKYNPFVLGEVTDE